MTGLDWIIVAFATLMAWLGLRQGFIVGALCFAGFAAGAFVGTRVGPLLLAGGAKSPYAPAFGLFGALIAGAILASGLGGIGSRLRRILRVPGLGLLDGALGALLSAAVGLGIVWIAAAVVAQTPGTSQLRADIQHSLILRGLNGLLPPSGPILNALARLDPLPQLSAPVGPVAPPARTTPSQPAVRAARGSVVRVLGTACGLAIEGSGWVAAPDTVVTNAHVVAGERDTTVEVAGAEPGLSVQVLLFNPTIDIAVLRVPGLDLPALRLAAAPARGSEGAILGFPEDGPFRARPARIGQTQTIVAQNAYGVGSYARLLTPVRGLVQPGNSGGPLVNARGEVLTTIFARTTTTSGGGEPGGFGVANATVRAALSSASGQARAPVGTGPCSSS